MIENTNICQCCSHLVSYQTAIRIACGHVVCNNCYLLNTKGNTVKCPYCSQLCYIYQCLSLSSVNIRNLSDSNQIVNSIHQQLICRVESELAVLGNMLNQTDKIRNNTLELFKQYELHVRQTVLHLTQMLETIQNSIVSKIEKISTANQKGFVDYLESVKSLVEKRKQILENVIRARKKGENLDFNTQIEVNNLKKIDSVELQFYKLEFCYDIFEISKNLGNSLVTSIKFPLDSIAVIAESPINLEQIPIILKNNDEEIREANINPDPSNINSSDSLVNPQQDIQVSPKKNLIQPLKKTYPREDCEEIQDKRINDNEFSDCKWFIDVKGSLKPLPRYVCVQIEKYKQKPGVIHIKNPKEGNKVYNQADLERMKYYTLDQYGNRSHEKTYKLVHLS